MKRVLIILLFVFGAFLQLMACDVSFTIAGDKKEVYKADDEIVIEVSVKLIHRHCPVDMKDTKFSYEGLKIIGATEWKEIQPGVFTRKVKAKITNEKLKQAKLTVTRKCEKEGGLGVMTIKIG